MGLDMFLSRRHYVKRWAHQKMQFTVTVSYHGEPYPAIKPERVSYVIEEVCYWRKANAVHAWFVRNVQGGIDDCREADVDVTQLAELRDLCRRVLADHSKAHELLPSQPGFFFGPTEYGDWYFQDIEHTEKTLTELLEEDASLGEDVVSRPRFSYHSSW